MQNAKMGPPLIKELLKKLRDKGDTNGLKHLNREST